MRTPGRCPSRPRKYLKEIAATHSPYVIDLVAGPHPDPDHDGLPPAHPLRPGRTGRVGRMRPAALPGVPAEPPVEPRPPVLTYVLYENGLPPNHTAGGQHELLPGRPADPAGRDLLHPALLQGQRAVQVRAASSTSTTCCPSGSRCEWFIEGGRSRDAGKLRPPASACSPMWPTRSGAASCDDAVLIPVAIAYDQIQDIGAYTDGAARRGQGARELLLADQGDPEPAPSLRAHLGPASGRRCSCRNGSTRDEPGTESIARSPIRSRSRNWRSRSGSGSTG